MKIRLLFLILAALAGSAASLRAADTINAPGEFSYTPPTGWEISDYPQSKFQIARGPVTDGLPANLNVVAETYDGLLADYVASNKQTLQNTPMFSNLKFVDEAPFVTASGAKGVRLLITDTLNKRDLQQIFYFFSASKDKLVVTATCVATQSAQMTPLFDASLKTFTPQ